MKRYLALLIAAAMVFALVPAGANGGSSPIRPAASSARTTLLDLTGTGSSASNASEGWAFDPQGRDGKPLLTLDSYGLEGAHSAPIVVPADTTVTVSGDCYIDNICMGKKYSVLAGSCDGYLHIEGDGTLNLYAEEYSGRCIDLPGGGTNTNDEFLVISGVTVNCYNRERDMNTAFSNEACIFGCNSVTITDATVNCFYGRWGIYSTGYTPIGGVSEETANEILIDNSTVNIYNYSENGINQYAIGIEMTFGRVRITGDSHVTINAGANSIYSYLSLVLEGGTLDISSIPVTSGEAYPLVKCDRLEVKNGLSRVRIAAAKYKGTCVLLCKSEGGSTLGSDLEVVRGSFENGDFASEADPQTGLPVLEICEKGPDVLLGDVNDDKKVDFGDVSALASFLVGTFQPTEQGLLNADVDGVDGVDSADLVALYRLLLSMK